MSMASQVSINSESKIYIAGHSGLAGSAIYKHLEEAGYLNLIGYSSGKLDLRDLNATTEAFAQDRPEVVIMAAARVGGIEANKDRPVEFLLDNIKIQNCILEASHLVKVPKVLFLGSSCIYPKFAPQPINESSLLTGELEPTNEAYAIAKIAGIKLIQAYRREYGYSWISAMPTNLYGPGDNFNPETSHVLAALVRKFSDANRNGAKQVEVWGSGTPRREFLHSSDLASAVELLLKKYDKPEIINIGTGIDLSIKELAELIAAITGFEGEIVWNKNKPDRTPRKVLDVSKIHALGWRHAMELESGLKQVCVEYANKHNGATDN